MSALLPFDASLGLVSVTQTEHDSVNGFLYPAQLHYSYDFGLAVGTDVLAIEGGTVFSVVNNVPDGQTMAPLNSGLDAVTFPQLGPGGTGNQVTIYHASLGLYVTYAHLAQGSVPYVVGQTVAQGAVIGEIGLTGTGTGPHLQVSYGTSLTGWGGSTSNVYPTTQIANGAVATNPAGFELLFDEARGSNLELGGYQSNNQNILQDAATSLFVGPELLVNATTSGYQYSSGVSTQLIDGRFLVVWNDAGQSIGDRSEWAIRAQLFDETGTKSGAEFLVNTTTNGNQYSGGATALKDGGFVIVWGDDGVANGEIFGWVVRAQVFTSTGLKSGPEFRVDTSSEGYQDRPNITELRDGNFVVTWNDRSSDGGDIRGQIFTPDGVTVGAKFLVNTITSGNQFDSSVTALNGGSFVVTWNDWSSAGADNSEAIRAQVFTAEGEKSGAEFLVNSTTQGRQLFPEITSLSEERFVVTWTDESQTGGDSSGAAIRAQIFNMTGAKYGAEILVNTSTQGDQSYSELAALSDGRFVITWQDSSATAGDTSSLSIRAQVFEANGTKSGSEFLVNTTTSGQQSGPSVTALNDGRFVVNWTDFSQTGGDTSGSAIRAQIFDANGIPELANHTPTATGSNIFAAVGSTVPLSGLFTWSDPDGAGDVTHFAVQDRTAGGGYLTFNDVAQLSNTVFERPIAELSQWAFHVGTGVDQIGFNVIDKTGASNPSVVATVASMAGNPNQNLLEYFAKVVAYDPSVVVAGGYKVDQVFTYGTFEAVALVSADPAVGKEPILAIRGTIDSAFDWGENGDPSGVGYTEFEAAWNNPDHKLQDWVHAHPGVNLTGHSQGGAQVQLLVVEATLKGWRLGDVMTFNSPGINVAINDAAVKNNVRSVVHVISAGDIVEQAGDDYIQGTVFRYNFDTFSVNLINFLSDTHTNHWSNQILDNDPLLDDGRPDTGPSYVISPAITSDQLGSGTFSHLFSGGVIDREFFGFLLAVSALPLPPVLGITDAPTISTALMTRAGTEDLRTSVGQGLAVVADLINGGISVSAAVYSAMITVGRLEVAGALTIKEWTADQWRGVAHWSADVWETVRDWPSDAWQAISHWTSDQWNAVENWTAAAWQKTVGLTADAWHASVNWGADAFDYLSDRGAAAANAVVAGVVDIGHAIGSGALDLYNSTHDAATYWLDFIGNGEVVESTAGTATANSTTSAILHGGVGLDLLLGGSSNDLFLGGGGADTSVLWGIRTSNVQNLRVALTATDSGILSQGSDTIIGTAAELNGDTVYGFATDDAIFVAGAQFTAADMTIIKGSAILHVDTDQDGTVDFVMTLKGEYDISAFVLEARSTGTIIKYNGYLGPVLVNDSGVGFGTNAGAAFVTGNVFANDKAFDGGGVQLVSFDASGLLGHLTYNDDGTFNYDPTGAFDQLGRGEVATEVFSYIATDATGLQSEADVTIALTGSGNAAPVAVDDTASTRYGMSSAAIAVLFNDTDDDNDILALTDIGTAAHGQVADNGDGTVTYTPNAGFFGSDSFVYTVSDGYGGTDTGLVKVEVGAPAPTYNMIYGTSRSDNLRGTKGDDAIFSLGGKNDRMTGGRGDDVFVFQDEINNGIHEHDRIKDFKPGSDSILLLDDNYSITFHRKYAVITVGDDADEIRIDGRHLTEAKLDIHIGSFDDLLA